MEEVLTDCQLKTTETKTSATAICGISYETAVLINGSLYLTLAINFSM